jgi:predicted RNase H-like nuclease (RuvC/YqgF family)
VENSTLSTECRGTRVASSITRGTSSGSSQSRGTSSSIGEPAGKAQEGGLREEVERLRAENDALRLELDTTRQERDDYEATLDEFIKDHKGLQEKALTPDKRDRILATLVVGKQSPLYKRVKAVFDQMMQEDE